MNFRNPHCLVILTIFCASLNYAPIAFAQDAGPALGVAVATGAPRSSFRVEIRSVDIATWVADTYTSVEGQSMLVQSYHFGRR